MKYFFDTEFDEDGKTIEPISIGIVDENGRTFYAEWNNLNLDSMNEFVLNNVIPNLILWDEGNPTEHLILEDGSNITMIGNREEIREELLKWIGKDKPNFYAWYASYDWIMLCQIFGTMLDLPEGWPKYVNDVKQTFDELNMIDKWKEYNHPDTKDTHNSLADALWLKDIYNDFYI